MPIYAYRSDGEVIEEIFPMGRAPRTITRDGKKFRRVFAVPGMKVENTPDRYLAWFNSDQTQARLKSGDLEIARPSSDVNHI